MSAHTPGPWLVKGDEVGYISKHDDQSFGMFCPIATVCDEADAHLVAAAPELLEALKRFERAFDWFVGRSAFTQGDGLKGLGHSQKVRVEVYAAHDAARAAIQKAEGAKP